MQTSGSDGYENTLDRASGIDQLLDEGQVGLEERGVARYCAYEVIARSGHLAMDPTMRVLPVIKCTTPGRAATSMWHVCGTTLRCAGRSEPPIPPLTSTFLKSERRESNPRSQLGKLMFCR
jgi:hypothetical protein